jgi:L-threonylcarbamoyladenylate synthase
MQVVDLHADNLADVLHAAVDSARRGDLMLFPTDTVYGLGGLAFSKRVAEKLRLLKPERDAKPTAVLIDSILRMSQCAGDVPGPKIVHLAEKYWPGPLTLVWKTSSAVPEEYLPADRSLGYRVPKADFLLRLLRELEIPLWATSANLPGRRPPGTYSEIDATVVGACDWVIRTERRSSGKSSTVVDVRQKEPQILREGALSAAEILQTWKQG